MKVFDNTVTVVTGGAVRIGHAIAVSLARSGAKVIVHYNRSSEDAGAAVQAIRRAGGDAVSVQADLSKTSEACRTIFDAANDVFGPVTSLINNASIFEPGTVPGTSDEHWDRHFNVNLKAPFFLTQRFVEQLDGRSGHVINIADWRGTRPCTGHAAYTLTKSALVAMTRNLALELAPDVQVNAVAPGATLPPPGESDSYLRRVQESIPLQRRGTPEGIAEAVRFLLASDFITGEVLHVAGGEQL